MTAQIRMRLKSYKMVIIPFLFVPYDVVFRYKNDWWRRKKGTMRQAEKFDDEAEPVPTLLHIGEEESCAVAKSMLRKKGDACFTVDEFDVCLIPPKDEE